MIRMGLGGVLGLFLLEAVVAFLQFFYPREYLGAFGGKVTLGKPSAFPMPSITQFLDAHAYLSHVPEGFLALWWKCPHLGCTVQWHPEEPTEDTLAPMGRFHCPCHGSIYNRYGQIISGPAPRPMDLFQLSLVSGQLVADTSIVIQRPHWEPNQAFKA
jgi:cytochrome b6-f complex iron-sulfur subunit